MKTKQQEVASELTQKIDAVLKETKEIAQKNISSLSGYTLGNSDLEKIIDFTEKAEDCLNRVCRSDSIPAVEDVFEPIVKK
jgi:hypothetical protein